MAGLIVGGFLGMFFMCMMFVARDRDEERRKSK